MNFLGGIWSALSEGRDLSGGFGEDEGGRHGRRLFAIAPISYTTVLRSTHGALPFIIEKGEELVHILVL
jgi:hypothetical protein